MHSKKKIGFLFPGIMEGSGGHQTIFNHAQALIENGYDVTLYVESRKGLTKERAKQKISIYYGIPKVQIEVGYKIPYETDLLFATSWVTAKSVVDIKIKGKKAYFIQDYEPSFYPQGYNYIAARETYKFNLIPITIGKWLSIRLQKEFGTPSFYFDFSSRTDIYRPIPNIKKQKSICFLYQPDKPRRCAELGIEALKLVKAKMPEVSIYLFGSKPNSKSASEFLHLGLLSPKRCNELYNKCSIGLNFSSTNPSRNPFDMMASGLPVVELYSENNFFDLPGNIITFANPDPQSVAYAIISKLQSPESLKKISSEGICFMKNKSTEVEVNGFIKIVNEIVEMGSIGNTISYTIENPKNVIAPKDYFNEISTYKKVKLRRKTSTRKKIIKIFKSLSGRKR